MVRSKEWDRAHEGVIFYAMPGALIGHFVDDVIEKRKAYGRLAEVWATWNGRTARVHQDDSAVDVYRALMGMDD